MHNPLNQLVRNVHLAVVPLRIVLVLTFAILVLLQVMSLPGQFRHMAQESPDLAYLRWPMLTVSVLMVACAQVVIVCIWRLLGMVRDDHIFSRQSFAWVDAIVWAIVAAWLLLAGTSLYFAADYSDPALPLILILLLLAGAVLALLMVVMRTLLWHATALRTDLDGVI